MAALTLVALALFVLQLQWRKRAAAAAGARTQPALEPAAVARHGQIRGGEQAGAGGILVSSTRYRVLGSAGGQRVQPIRFGFVPYVQYVSSEEGIRSSFEIDAAS
jgi:hypothetical protein